MEQKYVVIYDSDCIFCSHWVQFVLKRDKNDRVRFTPLTGDTAAAFFAQNSFISETDDLWLIAPNGQYWSGSSASLRTITLLGGVYRLAHILLFIPRFIRETIYRYIAKRRRFLMKHKTCPIIPQEYEHKFIQ